MHHVKRRPVLAARSRLVLEVREVVAAARVQVHERPKVVVRAGIGAAALLPRGGVLDTGEW